MLRPTFDLPRALALGTVAILVVGGTATPAFAQAEERRVVLDSAPGHTGWQGAATIRGHLEGATGGEEITLERQRGSSDWKQIASEPVDEEGRVRFERQGLRKTADYRLAFHDDPTDYTSTSESARITVAPKVTVELGRRHVMKGRRVRVFGTLRAREPGRRVALHQKVEGEWRFLDRVAAGDGSFTARLRAKHSGYRRIRVTFAGDGTNTGGRARTALRVYRRAPATWYGPGFYGQRTACGQRLGRGMLGVAHRSLPCGTKVSMLYEGRTITVPVIDRGPYTSADWDLTEETADRLHFEGSDAIGVTTGG